MREIERLNSSFRDPSGFLFRHQEVLYRAIHSTYQANYEHLMTSGLYEELVSAHALIPHDEVSFPLEGNYVKVIRPKELTYIAYPYEWCFGFYRDAALHTLSLLEKALDHGMILKDASAYNIQPYLGRPILIDTLSFERYQPDRPWVAYRQFCQHFLAPLALMSYRSPQLAWLMREYLDGIPLALSSKLLPRSTRFRMNLLMHIHLHARAQRRHKASAKPTGTSPRKFTKASFRGLIHSLKKAIIRLPSPKEEGTWDGYYSEEVSNAYLQEKQQRVREFLQEIQPASTWDLGANEGVFSKIAAEFGPTLAIDDNHGSLDQLYQQIREKEVPNLFPLHIDITNPSPAIGWNNSERPSWINRSPQPELIMALGLIHHLCISNHLSFEQLSHFFAQNSTYLLVEFIPKSDPKLQRLLQNRKDVFAAYSQENFERVFEFTFDIIDTATFSGNNRILYFLKTR